MLEFNSIPLGVRTPGAYLEFDSTRAVGGLPAATSRILLIGQKLSVGSKAALTPTRIANPGQANALFGRGSQLAAMAAALLRVNQAGEAWAIALDDVPGGTAATGTITLTGPATVAGTLFLMVDGQRVPVGVVAGATPAQVAANVAAAVNAQPDLLVTATAAAGVATLTARHKGTIGNGVDIRINYYQGETTPAGLGVAIGAMAGGTTDPDLAAVFAAIGDAGYQSFVLPFVDAATLAATEAELVTRAGPMKMIEGLAYGAVRATLGAALALGSSRNSQFVSLLPAKASPTSPWAWAAAYAGVIAFHAAIDPARPFQTLPLTGLLPPAIVDRYTQAEREQLLRDDMSTFTVDQSGTVLIERAITTYQVSPTNAEDIAWLDLNTPLTLFYLRLAVRSRILLKFPRAKLANDSASFVGGSGVVTPKIIRAELIALFRDLEAAGLVEELDQFAADIRVERDPGDPNRVNALIPPNIVNQFRVLAGRVEFRL